MLEKINIHKGLEGYYETDLGQVVPKTICNKCRWCYLFECDMPKVTTRCRVTNLELRPKCHEINTNGNCPYYERRERKHLFMDKNNKRIPWYKPLLELLEGGYGP